MKSIWTGRILGYLGGAIATHFRVGNPALIWGGLLLRDPRVRALVLLRPAHRML